jgi:hypothetical protein
MPIRSLEVRVQGTDTACHWYVLDEEGGVFLWNAQPFPSRAHAMADFEVAQRGWAAQQSPVAFQRSQL